MKKITKSRKWSLLKKVLKQNVRINKYVLMDMIVAIYTTSFFVSTIPDIMSGLSYIKGEIQELQEDKSVDNEELEKELDATVTCANLRSDVSQGYYVENRILYHETGEKLDLTGETKPLILGRHGIETSTLASANLRNSNISFIFIDFIAITNDFVYELPESLQTLEISRCDFITDLSYLSDACPNLEELGLERVTSLESFDFIYKLKNLHTLYITDSYGITDELLDYCNNADIKVISHGNEVENTKEIKRIASEIIDDNMSDKEKIRAICTYIVDTIKYDKNLSSASNEFPLEYALNNKGVCISYAYLASCLFKEAGITSYRVNSIDHVWNLVKVDDEYFYIDPTNLDVIFLNKLIYKIFGISPYYMSDPNQNLLLSSKNIDSKESNIPSELLKDVLALEDEKTLIEKYASTVGLIVIILLEIARYALFWFGLDPTLETLESFFDTLYSVYDSYKYELEKERRLK